MANTWGLFQNVEIGVLTANATHSFSFPVPFPANAEGFLLRLYTYTFKIIYLLTYFVGAVYTISCTGVRNQLVKIGSLLPTM